jgi:hypothetical protein
MHIMGQTQISMFDKYESVRIIIVAGQQTQTLLSSPERRDMRGPPLVLHL